MSILWRRGNAPYKLYRIRHELTKTLPVLSQVRTNTNTVTNVKPNSLLYNTVRFKSKKQTDADSDDESEVFDGDDISLSRDSKVIKINTTSLRTDAILKSALGVARNKVEKLFYESKIRVNGKKILKKSIQIKPEYEIDVIKSVSPKNPDHLYISRVEILNIAAKEENIVITARRFKTLLIENYDTDPYKPSTSEEDQ